MALCTRHVVTIYRPTVAQDVGGDHSINKALGRLLQFVQRILPDKRRQIAIAHTMLCYFGG